MTFNQIIRNDIMFCNDTKFQRFCFLYFKLRNILVALKMLGVCGGKRYMYLQNISHKSGFVLINILRNVSLSESRIQTDEAIKNFLNT